MVKKICMAAICSLSVFACLLPGGVHAADAPIVSLNVIDAEVSDVLAALGSMGNVNIVADKVDAGKITVRFDGINLYKALEFIAKTKGLDYEKVGDVIVVCAKGGLAANFGALHIFKLDFAEPIDAALAASLSITGGKNQKTEKDDKKSEDSAAISTAKNQKIDYNVSKRFQIDRATNSLLFFGSAEEAGRIRDLLKVIDVAYPQVSLEAKVIAINKDEIENLGVAWEWSDEQEIPGTVTFGRDEGKKSFGVYYTAKIDALIAHNKAAVLARPNIMTINGKEAVINIGGEVPVPTVSVTNSTAQTSIEYRESGIILRYIPRINKDGFITAEVHTEVSSPVYVPEVNAYRFNKRSADTSIRLKDGETMVIGGLIGSEEIKSISKIPFFGDLPVLGRFFSCVKNNKNESEIMIFLTAHIVK